MLFEETIKNMRYLLREITVATPEQLILFFRDEADSRQVMEFIWSLKRRGEVDYDVQTGLVFWHKKLGLKEYAMKERIRAFWVVAYFGSIAVRDISVIKQPLTFEVLLNSAKEGGEIEVEVYDIAICNTTLEALAIARAIDRNKLKDIPDEVVHIVIVPDEEMGERLAPYGFDTYVTLHKATIQENQALILTPEFHSWGT